MRGKLRDKRTLAKRDLLKRDGSERKRPTRRENKNLNWLYQQLEAENDNLDVDDEGTLIEIQKKK